MFRALVIFVDLSCPRLRKSRFFLQFRRRLTLVILDGIALASHRRHNRTQKLKVDIFPLLSRWNIPDRGTFHGHLWAPTPAQAPAKVTTQSDAITGTVKWLTSIAPKRRKTRRKMLQLRHHLHRYPRTIARRIRSKPRLASTVTVIHLSGDRGRRKGRQTVNRVFM